MSRWVVEVEVVEVVVVVVVEVVVLLDDVGTHNQVGLLSSIVRIYTHRLVRVGGTYG